MKVKTIVTILAAGAIAAGCADTQPPPNQPQSQPTKTDEKVTFRCKEGFDSASQKKLPTTYARNERGKIAVVRWETTYFKDYTPQQRCEEVSPRFQTAYENGSLQYLTNGTMNGEPVICTARSDGGDCDTLIMTLRRNDDPKPILAQLNDTFQGRSTGPIRHSSNKAIYIKVDIEEFLKNAPVEPD